MKQGRRLRCHSNRAGRLGSQTEPVLQKCAPSSPATSPRQGPAPILTCRNRYLCRFRRMPRLQLPRPRPDPHRHAIPVHGCGPN